MIKRCPECTHLKFIWNFSGDTLNGEYVCKRCSSINREEIGWKELKIRTKPSDHHPWCNFYDRVGKCNLCERLERNCPWYPDACQESMMKKHFPENKVVI
jgi:hypothetical protein